LASLGQVGLYRQTSRYRSTFPVNTSSVMPLLKPLFTSMFHFPRCIQCSRKSSFFFLSLYTFFYHAWPGLSFFFSPRGGRMGDRRRPRGRKRSKSVTSYFAYYTKHISLYYILFTFFHLILEEVSTWACFPLANFFCFHLCV
jgi:hypothetical protein